MKLNEFDKAKTCLFAAVKSNVNDKGMRQTLEVFKEKYKAWNQAEKQKQREMFGGKF